jgi:hypothetical protein
MNDIIFKKQNGGMGRTAPNNDPVSGLLLGLNTAIADDNDEPLARFDPITLGTDAAAHTLYIARMKFYEQLADDFGISPVTVDESAAPSNAQAAMNFMDYHVKEFFRMSPYGTLYLAVRLSGDITGADIESIQDYAGGELRQAGIGAAGDTAITATQISAWQATASTLEQQHQPLSIIVGLRKGKMGKIGASLASTGGGLSATGRCNVSLVVAQDLNPELIAGMKPSASKNLEEVAAIGTALGAVSAASVHESIAWVQKFPLGLLMPGFVTGELVKEVSKGIQDFVDQNRYIFARTYTGEADCYFNDSHTLDKPTSDYAYIENVRTMDKATRGIRANLLPYLNAPLYVDAATGKLRADTVAVLETVAGRALEDMEKAGELSGYKAVIDPDQNVLATSLLEVIIQQVPVGVMRKVTVKIGFTTKL